MNNATRWSIGVITLLVMGGIQAWGQDHGQQRMMMPRVPADNMDEARAFKNPLSDSPEVLERGKGIYEGKGTCINCHGEQGRGDGPGAAEMNPPPRVFRSHGFWRHRTEGEIFWVIKHGVPGTGMIAFGGMLTDEEIWSVMQYERSFAAGPSGGGMRGPRGGGHQGGGGRHGGGGRMRHDDGHDNPSEGIGLTIQNNTHEGYGSKKAQKVEKARASTVSITDAIGIALQQTPGTVLEAEFEIEDGQALWEIEVATEDGRIMEILVDSQTGDIVTAEEKGAGEKEKKKKEKKGKKKEQKKKGQQRHGSDTHQSE
jgi:mono/diheme cytochrome c family protein